MSFHDPELAPSKPSKLPGLRAMRSPGASVRPRAERRAAERLDYPGASVPPLADLGAYEDHATLHRMRDLARDADLRSVACCGLAPIPGPLGEDGRRGEGRGRIERVADDPENPTRFRGRVSGVVRCSSPWTCSVCGPRLAMRRAAELAPQVEALEEAGWTTWVLTLTVSHAAGDDPGEQLRDLSRAWRLTTSGRGWMETKTLGVEYVRGWDVTKGRHGFHFHLHLVLLLSPQHEDPEAVAKGFADRWREKLGKCGREARPRAQDVQRARSARAAVAYAMTIAGVTKDKGKGQDVVDGVAEVARCPGGSAFNSVAEAVAAAAKRGREKGGKTMADLRDIALEPIEPEPGRAGAKRRNARRRKARADWITYAKITKGKRAVVVSQNLKLAPEEDAPESQEAPRPEVVAVMGKLGLRRIDSHLPELLAAVECGAHEGRMVLRRYLGNPGDLWDLPPPTPPPRPSRDPQEPVPF